MFVYWNFNLNITGKLKHFVNYSSKEIYDAGLFIYYLQSPQGTYYCSKTGCDKLIY